jgi:hypothetical protein
MLQCVFLLQNVEKLPDFCYLIKARNFILEKFLKIRINSFSNVCLLAAMKAQRGEGGGRILLGDNTGGLGGSNCG